MGICLNQKYIKCMLLDYKSSKENTIQAITLNKEDNDKLENENIKDNKNEINKNILQNDKIKLSFNNNDKLNNKNQIISYQIKSKYKTKFFNNSFNNNLNNISINSINEPINSNINNNCDKFIFFTNLKDKKENALASTTNASNSKL